MPLTTKRDGRGILFWLRKRALIRDDEIACQSILSQCSRRQQRGVERSPSNQMTYTML